MNYLEAFPNMIVKKSDIVRAVLVRSKAGLLRSGCSLIRFYENAAVIINSDNSPKGTLWLIKFKYFFYFFL